MEAHETVHSGAPWVREAPNYRVNFWQKMGESWGLDAHVLTGVENVEQVLRWAEGRRDGREVEIFVGTELEPIGPVRQERKSALVRVFGTNPNAGKTSVVGVARRVADD